LAPGDEVLAAAPFSFGSFVTTTAELVVPKPEGVSLEEAATVPIAFLTAHYALNHLGRLSEGERVLIHSATGGVGLAAIQLARRAGAEIFATAGTEEKRNLLRSLGIEHVMDSRTLAFADQVLEATEGRGVDVVLNSLAGEAIHKGLAILADDGRFLEIGKRDIYQNSRLGLRPFRKNLSFMGIDLDRAFRDRPRLLARLFEELMEGFQDGSLTPLCHRVFPMANVVGAFRYMAQAKHIGKVVVSLQEQEVSVAPSSEDEVRFVEDGTYLITGGLGGFGLVAAKWMVERGARHLALVGRSGASSPEAQAAVEGMRGAGAEVRVAKADVSSPEQLAGVLSDIKASMPPLRGVLHAAMVLRDSLLLNLNEEQLREVWAPKVTGGWNLHTQTLDSPLDFFVLFSSMSAVFGAGGQGNYASANTFLESLAHYRKARGLPGLSVSWGALGEVGVVARQDDIARRFEAMGLKKLTPRQALTLLGRFVQNGSTQVGVMRVDWRRFGETAAAVTLSPSPRFAQLIDETAEGAEDSLRKSGSALRNALLAAGPDERREMMETAIREQVARVLGASPDKLDVEKPLTELGLDSLMSVELRNWVEGDLRLSLPTVELLRGPSVIKLVDLLLEQLSDGDSTLTAPATAEIPHGSSEEDEEGEDAGALLSKVDDMSDDQVDALLEEMEEEAAG
jgi:NADPH:quinone reductase-like Zn-dependent oxidoreductase/acyl carrier protein